MNNVISAVCSTKRITQRITKQITSQLEADQLVIQENDIIQFQRGKSFRVTEKVIEQNNVTIGAFGVGENPIIKGSEILEGFANDGNGIYSIEIAGLKWVYINGQDAKLARTADYNIASIPAPNMIYFSSPDLGLQGSTMISRQWKWMNDIPFSVIGYDQYRQITLDRDHGLTNGTMVWFVNKASFIQNDYDWAYENGVLYIKLPSDPSNFEISGVFDNFSFDVQANNTSISGLKIQHYFATSINARSNTDLTKIKNNEITLIRGEAIDARSGGDAWDISGNHIHHCDLSGIIFRNQNNSFFNNNIIHDIGNGNNRGWTTYTQLQGVGIGAYGTQPEGQNCEVIGNEIYNTAYNGISLHQHKGFDIGYNIIHDTHIELEDGGGIYIYHAGTHPDITGHHIHHNFIYNIPGHTFNEAGIYLDNWTNGCELNNNVVYDCGFSGIMLNSGTKNNNLHHNTVFNCPYAAVWYRDWSYSGKLYVNDGNNLEHNILVAKAAGNYLIRTSDGVSPFANGGIIDNNYYVMPYSSIIANLLGVDSNFPQLKTAFSQDVDSISHDNYIVAPGDPDNELLLVTNINDIELSGVAPSGVWKDVSGQIITNYSIGAWDSIILMSKL